MHNPYQRGTDLKHCPLTCAGNPENRWFGSEKKCWLPAADICPREQADAATKCERCGVATLGQPLADRYCVACGEWMERTNE